MLDYDTIHEIRYILENRFDAAEVEYVISHFRYKLPIFPALTYICEQITDESVKNYLTYTSRSKIDEKDIYKLVILLVKRRLPKDVKYIDWSYDFKFTENEIELINMYCSTEDVLRYLTKKRTYFDDDYIRHKLQKALIKDKKIKESSYKIWSQLNEKYKDFSFCEDSDSFEEENYMDMEYYEEYKLERENNSK